MGAKSSSRHSQTDVARAPYHHPPQQPGRAAAHRPLAGGTALVHRCPRCCILRVRESLAAAVLADAWLAGGSLRRQRGGGWRESVVTAVGFGAPSVSPRDGSAQKGAESNHLSYSLLRD
ncbi:Os09g0321401 [Oryza sativa Japonica Group]|nr:Os09g0321401 [Oryza sativa Japonica Group]